MAFLILSLAAGTAPAQNAAKPEPAGKDAPIDEVTIIGRRSSVPDINEQLDFHNEEYRRLKAQYDPDPPPPSRANRLLTVPMDTFGAGGSPSASDVVRNP
ncbi:MAG TPA: hypothetical protein VED40_06070 [Azospirillaceae bacterium]|nr:hypothetical protein [Azospirillaceae bacterium]